jgi:putative peptidoglycan lipid II flippase
VLAHYLGLGDAADAFAAAFRIPNFLQNLLGEGVLAASFIPVYARLRGQGREADARVVAGAVAGLLGVVTAVVVALGVTGTPWLVAVLAPGFDGGKRDLTIRLVRILFPGAGLLVYSAWCLGILNSHRRFFLSYSAPVLWNGAIVAATLLQAGRVPEQVVIWTAWGAVAGALLQFGVQLPTALRLAGAVPLRLAARDDGTRTVLRNFWPAFAGRGVVQISAFVDAILASLLPTGAVAAMLNAQLLYTLPVSLFGMSVAAAELPGLSEEAGRDDAATLLRERLQRGMAQVSYFVVPSAIAFLFLGHIIAAAVFQTGRFTAADAHYVWAILAGASIGLLASTLGRLFASGWYALQDTRRPLRYAVLRVALTIVFGYLASVHGPRLLGLDPRWGAVGLTLSSGGAGWLEFLLLRRSLAQRVGAVATPAGLYPRLWIAALAGAGAAWGVLLLLDGRVGPVLRAVPVLGAFGLVYLGLTLRWRLPPAVALVDRVRRRP